MAESLMEAHVKIGAKLEPLRRGLAKAKAAVVKAVAAMQRAFEKLYSVSKKVFLGLAVYLGIASVAAMKQEDAEFQLAAALKITGEYTDALMKKFKAFASSIQQVTTYGDEDVLMVMRMGSTLGLTAKELEKATKAALGLGAAFGGRMRPEMAMRYIVQAMRGEYSSLATYIVALKSAETPMEKQRVLQEALTNAWAIAEAQALTTSGALKQMKNTIGDILFEAVGKPFLDNIRRSAKRIKKWAEDNQDKIKKLAEQFDRLVEVGAKVISKFAGPLINTMTELTKKFADFATASKLENAIWAVGEWTDKIWNRIKALYQGIKGLWESEILGKTIGDAFKYAFDKATAQLERWGKQIKIIISAIAGTVGYEFSQRFGETIGRGMIDIADKISNISTLILVPLQKAMYMGGTKLLEERMGATKPSMGKALERAGRVPLREVGIPPYVHLLITNVSVLIKAMDEATKEKWRQIRAEFDVTRKSTEAADKQLAAAGGPPPPGGGDGKGARFGTVGLREAWSQMVSGMKADPALTLQEKLIATLEKVGKMLDGSIHATSKNEVAALKTAGTVGE